MVEHGRLRTQERKVATVLFADLADSTSLGERLDIEPLAQVMGAFHRVVCDAVERCEGSAEFVGDGVVAIFGAPTAIENHQGRALEAADLILDAIDRLNDRLVPSLGTPLGVRIGINTGDVLVDSGADLGVGAMASDAFNVAARLEQTARVGEIVVSERTLGPIRDRAVVDLGRLDITGRAQPIRAFVVSRAGSAEPVMAHEPRLVDREGEMATLTSLFDHVLTTAHSRIVTILGEAGIGKSVLLDAFVHNVTKETPMPVAVGVCRAFGKHGPLAPIGGLLESALQEPPGRRRLAELLGPGSERQVDALVRAFGPEDGEVEPGSTPGRAAQELTAAWRAVVTRLTADEPWLFAIEDIHWAEPETLDLIRAMVDAPGHGALIVVTARTELSPVWSLDAAAGSTITLEPLDPAGTRTLAASVNPEIERAPELARELHRLTEGNPFFTVEVMRSLSERSKPEDLSPRDIRGLAVPDSVQGVLADRIDRLDPVVKRVLHVASMIGREFFVAPIASVLDLERDALEAAIRDLIQRGLVETSTERGTPFRFVHALTRDVAYGSIPRRDLHGLHETVADWLESHPDEFQGDTAATIAFHLGQACASLDADWETTGAHVDAVHRRWVDWTVRAARRAITATAFTEAKRLARIAVDNAADDEQRVDALECLGNAHFFSYEGDDAWSVLTTAADLAATSEVRRMPDVATLYTRALASTVRWAGGVRHPPIPQELKNRIERASELLEPGDSVERVQLLTMVGFWPFATVGHCDTGLISEVEARTAALEAADMARRLGRVDLESAALDGLGSTHIFRGDYLAADDVTQRRCELFESLDDPWERGDLCAVAGWVAFERGRYDEALRWTTRGIDGAGDDYPSVALHCRNWRGLTRFRSGDWDGVLEELSMVEAASRPDGTLPPYTTPLAAAAALVHHLRNEEEQCDRLLRTLSPSDEAEGPPLSRWAEFVAPIVARRGDPDTAFEMIDCTAHRRASRLGQLFLARCHVVIESERFDRLGEFTSACRREATERGVIGLVPASLIAEGFGALNEGAWERAFEVFGRSRELAAQVGDPWWVGMSDIGLSEAALRLERIGIVRLHRSDAIQTFTRLGSVRELHRAGMLPVD
jgi:class 3 adenylate cyclase